ncbi:MAG: S4 domain-containing protein [Acidimicrobiales bacterium]
MDRWVWSIRLFKTRAEATAACRGGHVRVNRVPAKPATTVRVGDQVAAFAGGRERVVEVVRVIDKRVGAPLAAECYADHSPAPPAPELAVPPLLRDPATGRPTKRDRRQIDRLRRR